VIYEAPTPAAHSLSTWVRWIADSSMKAVSSPDSANFGLTVISGENGAVKVCGQASETLVGQDWSVDGDWSAWHHIAYSVTAAGVITLLVDGVNIATANQASAAVDTIWVGEDYSIILGKQISLPIESYSLRIYDKVVSEAALRALYLDGYQGKFLLEPLR
jgi:hypothetical protein